MALGVSPLPWGLWLARALDLPFTGYAVNGAGAADVRREQLPRVRAHFDLGCVYVGVNDVRLPGFDERAFGRDVDAILAGLTGHADRLLVCTLPTDLGRPTCAPKPERANAVLRAAAAEHGAAVAALDDLTGWTLVLPDAVHPTALGQVEIADRAARALGAAVLPSALAAPDPVSRGARARYGAVHARMLARDLVRRAVERRGTD
jgi:lysophospholipase L1-like esterase